MSTNVNKESVSLEETNSQQQAVNALNELILDEANVYDEKQIIKIIRFKQWLLEQSN